MLMLLLYIKDILQNILSSVERRKSGYEFEVV